jgi:flagellar assembly protein FliH
MERVALEARIGDLEARMAEREKQFALQLEEARIQAEEQGRNAAKSEQSQLLERCANEIGAVIERFLLDRDAYLARLEHEVVRLALSIAGRVLNREVQMDPLLLSGAVRVALGQLAATTAVRLRVPESECELWREMLRLLPNLPLQPELVADVEMHAGECVLETELGSVDLGVKAQLEEIELGFFDLLGRRDQIQGATGVLR